GCGGRETASLLSPEYLFTPCEFQRARAACGACDLPGILCAGQSGFVFCVCSLLQMASAERLRLPCHLRKHAEFANTTRMGRPRRTFRSVLPGNRILLYRLALSGLSRTESEHLYSSLDRKLPVAGHLRIHVSGDRLYIRCSVYRTLAL